METSHPPTKADDEIFFGEMRPLRTSLSYTVHRATGPITSILPVINLHDDEADRSNHGWVYIIECTEGSVFVWYPARGLLGLCCDDDGGSSSVSRTNDDRFLLVAGEPY